MCNRLVRYYCVSVLRSIFTFHFENFSQGHLKRLCAGSSEGRAGEGSVSDDVFVDKEGKSTEGQNVEAEVEKIFFFIVLYWYSLRPSMEVFYDPSCLMRVRVAQR